MDGTLEMAVVLLVMPALFAQVTPFAQGDYVEIPFAPTAAEISAALALVAFLDLISAAQHYAQHAPGMRPALITQRILGMPHPRVLLQLPHVQRAPVMLQALIAQPLLVAPALPHRRRAQAAQAYFPAVLSVLV